jgi:hypothetical protein
LTPLAPLGYVTARWVWSLFSHACLLAAAWLIWRQLGSDRMAGIIVAAVWAFGAAAGFCATRREWDRPNKPVTDGRYERHGYAA